MKYQPTFPERFGSLPDARAFMDRFVDAYNHEHHHTGIGLHTPADVHYGHAGTVAQQRSAALAGARLAPRTLHQQPRPEDPRATRRRLDQPTSRTLGRLTPTGLKHLDKFRTGDL